MIVCFFSLLLATAITNEPDRVLCLLSFSTSDDTKEYLSKSHADLINEPDAELLQNKSPKVDAKTLEPAMFPEDPDQEWCVAGYSNPLLNLFEAQTLTADLPSTMFI